MCSFLCKKSLVLYGWVGGCVSGWMDGSKSRFKDCLRQSICFLILISNLYILSNIHFKYFWFFWVFFGGFFNVGTPVVCILSVLFTIHISNLLSDEWALYNKSCNCFKFLDVPLLCWDTDSESGLQLEGWATATFISLLVVPFQVCIGMPALYNRVPRLYT